jgi:hypothetical protein
LSVRPPIVDQVGCARKLWPNTVRVGLENGYGVSSRGMRMTEAERRPRRSDHTTGANSWPIDP